MLTFLQCIKRSSPSGDNPLLCVFIETTATRSQNYLGSSGMTLVIPDSFV